jgi:hypothetical protein
LIYSPQNFAGRGLVHFLGNLPGMEGGKEVNYKKNAMNYDCKVLCDKDALKLSKKIKYYFIGKLIDFGAENDAPTDKVGCQFSCILLPQQKLQVFG